MPLNKQQMRMGHSEGHTDVCYEETGKHILTCGSDGDIRIWKSMDDDDPESVSVGDVAYAIALKNNRLYTASEANTIQAHTFPEGSPDGIVTRFTAPVTHFCLSQDGEKLLAGASDFSMKCIDIEGTNQKSFHGHNAPVLSVAIDPKNEYIASSSCDGTLKIWNIADQSWEKSVSLIPKCSDVSLSKTLCRLSWKPQSGEFLAVPIEKEVQIYERDSWDVTFTLTPQDVGGFVSLTAWSPCGQFLASANTDGNICIWDIITKKCIDRTKHNKGLAISGMAWNPANGNEIAYTDVMGQVGVLDNVIPPDRKTELQVPVFKQSADLFDDDAVDEDFLDAITQAEVENASKKPVNEEEDGDDVMPIMQHKRIMQIQDDDNSVDGSSRAGDDGVSIASGALDSIVPQPTYEGLKPTPLQKPFIPAATPVHLSSRFMKWNSVGIIRCYETEEESSIDVEFHDTSVHHAMHFDNQLNRTMADLSAEAVLLGSESSGDVQSQVVCYHFASWDNQKEWTTSMPKGENIKTLTLGHGWLAVATDKRLVRLFSIGGMQREVIAIPGPVVCIAGHGNQLIIVYHAGTGVPGEQCLGVQLLHVGGRKKCCIVSGDRLPVSPKATLVWLGFSAEGTPCIVDSEGVVRLLNRSLSSWVQIANTKNHTKSRSDHFWVVGLNENPQQLRCIQCKGAPFPPTLPRPAVMILPFQIPLCDLDTEKGIMEEAYWRADTLSKHINYSVSQGYEIDEMCKAQSDREKQDNIMKLFALACRTDREYRAAEICQLMTSQHAVSLAIKYASRSRRMALAERLNQLAQQMMEEVMAADEMEEEEEEEEHDGYYANTTNSVGRGKNSVERSTLSQSRVLAHHTSRQDGNDEAEKEEEGMEDDGGDYNDDDDGMPEMKSRKAPAIHIKPKKEVITSAFPSSQTRKNPFKRTSSETQVASKGSSVFDGMKKTTKLKAKSPPEKPSEPKQKKGKTQSTLFVNMKSPTPKEKDENVKEVVEESTPSKKTPSAFSYWLSENRSSLAEENAELSESDLIKLATQRWRSLLPEEKKEWGAKAKLLVQSSEADTEPKENAIQEMTELSEGKKRKLPQDGDVTQGSEKRVKGQMKLIGQDSGVVKKPLVSSTNSKLAGFAFKKGD